MTANTASAQISNPDTKTLRPTATVMVALIGAAALPSLATDMYLPFLPEISNVFHTPTAVTQLSLTGFLIMLGLGQLVAGPITDAVGRKKPIIAGLITFMVGCILAAMAPNIELLLTARLLQGIGGSLAVVVANSSVPDYSSGEGATKLYALLIGVVGLAPIIAPTVGGIIDTAFGWRSVFWILAALAGILLLWILLTLSESLPKSKRTPLHFRHIFTTYGKLLQTKNFILPAITLVIMFGALFAYIGGASYIYQENYGLNAATFGITFGASGIAMMIATLSVNRLSSHFGSKKLAFAGTSITFIGASLSVISVLTNRAFPLVLCAIVILVFGLGMCEPALMGQAMTVSESNSGQAAALLGSAQYLLGATSTVLAGIVAAQGPLAWTLLLTALSFCGLVLAATTIYSKQNY